MTAPLGEPAILVAGIGGASLGTEILKSLMASGRGYRVLGCDVSPYAFGHYGGDCEKTFTLPLASFADDVLELCATHGVGVVIPGGEAALATLSGVSAELARHGVHLAANHPEVVALCSDKDRMFQRLAELGIPIPRSVVVGEGGDLSNLPYPCIIKPATGSGGSRLTYLAAGESEASAFIAHLIAEHRVPVVQEYLPLDEGEFTIGVLTLPDGAPAGSIALRRIFDSKLSVSAETEAGLISSGYSQGFVDDFPEVRSQAEAIAAALGSRGPFNVQGRLRDGRLLPFEINPRFSASTYLRTLCGFNEIDRYLQWVLHGARPGPVDIRPGYCLRSFTEVHVPETELIR